MANALNTHTKQPYITAAGIAALQQQLATLKQTRASITEEIRELTSQSSNSSPLEDSIGALHRDRAIELDNQIASIERIINTARVVDRPVSNVVVQLGSQVTVDIAGTRRTFTIVGSIEADPIHGKISNESPLGNCLLGKKINDPLTGNFAGIIVAIQ